MPSFLKRFILTVLLFQVGNVVGVSVSKAKAGVSRFRVKDCSGYRPVLKACRRMSGKPARFYQRERPNYTNYMNQKWGLSLSYTQYTSYDSLLLVNPAAILCNQVSSPVVTDTLACIEGQEAWAVGNGTSQYNAYIETEKDLFRLSYVNTCSGANPNVSLTAPQKEYHYTLYYYDQADNLVRTVPPEGVTLLDSTQYAAVDSARDSGGQLPGIYPAHTLLTTYTYNTTNQVSQQQSPDGGTNRFWYDLLSRLVVSQNDKQADANSYSYTVYDTIGRITEVGLKEQTEQNLGSPDYLQQDTINRFYSLGGNTQITRTYYDYPVDTVLNHTNGIASIYNQYNLRKRVAASTYSDTQFGPALRATYYSYDIDGNVNTLWQQINGLYNARDNTGLKQIGYEYDLISGKVNFVAYQDNQPDAFYYAYNYDADNRITEAWTSPVANVKPYGFGSTLDPDLQKLDASYQYYLHGPLARMELGDTSGKVQGVDYAYTLQGWLKGVNTQDITALNDMGQDGIGSTRVARDAYGYSLGYYNGDYSPVGGSAFTAFAATYQQAIGDITGQSLYNGNISNSTMSLSAFSSGAPVGYTYHYDQLNRIKDLRQHSSLTSWSANNISPGYREDFTFDGNGNILSAIRTGATDSVKDSLTYQYNRTAGRLDNNKLNYLQGPGNASSFGLPQRVNNYYYDEIGEMTTDHQAGLDYIRWSVYGKILSINKGGNYIIYTYDPAGQRVTKTVDSLTTYYVRDAQGNTLAVYDNKNDSVYWREQHLYGSSRIGMWLPNVNLADSNAVAVWDSVGHKAYELTDHRGNVQATLSDIRIPNYDIHGNLLYYTPTVKTQQDYYAYGALQPGRQFVALGDTTFRYGYNGKENDNEISGIGNWQDYGNRFYSPQLVRFPSVDPLARQYPELSSYQFASNTPIQAVDLDGLEKYIVSNYYDNTHRLTKTAVTAQITDKAPHEIVDMNFRNLNGNKYTDNNVLILDYNHGLSASPDIKKSDKLTKEQQDIFATNRQVSNPNQPYSFSTHLIDAKSKTETEDIGLEVLYSNKTYNNTNNITSVFHHMNPPPISVNTLMSKFRGSNNYFVGVAPFSQAGNIGTELQSALSTVVQRLRSPNNPIRAITISITQVIGSQVSPSQADEVKRQVNTAVNNIINILHSGVGNRNIRFINGGVNIIRSDNSPNTIPSAGTNLKFN